MEQKKNAEICRTCLKIIKNVENVLPVHGISDLLMSYTSLMIIENDGLPSSICGSCHKRANQAYKFKLLCEQSDEKLRSNLNMYIKTISDTRTDTSKTKPESDSDNDTNCLLPETTFTSKGEVCFKFFKEKCAAQNNLNNLDKVVLSASESKKQESEEKEVTEDDKLKTNHLQCCFCDLTFTHQTRLLKHQIKHENGIKCYICGKDCQTLKQLSSHISIHNRKGAHLCQTCGKQFTMPENLVRHQRIHTGIRPYKCKLCSKSFTQSNELKSHMITHSAEKTHLCNVCGNKYARYMSLQVHMRRLHSDSSNKRPYQCSICGRAFKDKRDLSQHTSIHKGERKHVCKVCSKAFNRSSNLKVHERIHSGYRPFVCPVCQRAFIQKHVLNTHLRTHPNAI